MPFVDSHESVLIMLQNAEQQVEDLKLQLDDALGAEEMLVQLTERNLMLSEVLSFAIFLRVIPLWNSPFLDLVLENRGDAYHHRGPRSPQGT